MAWRAADAKRHFSQLIQQSQETPQIIELRGKPVSVVVSYERFVHAGNPFGDRSVAQWLEELRTLPAEERDVDPYLPERSDRPDQFGDVWG